MAITAILADDEALVRKSVRRFLHSYNVTIVRECEDGLACVAAIWEAQPDLVFLDLQMPELDGRQVIERVGSLMPPTVILTAFDDFAVQAYDANVVDYVLKPFGQVRFERAMARAMARLQPPPLTALTTPVSTGQNPAIVSGRLPQTGWQERIAVPLGEGRHAFVEVGQIEWIEARGNHLRLHCGAQHHDLRETLSGLQARLNPSIFLRIHRSTVVNLHKIEEVKMWFKGHHLVLLRSGKQLRMSRHQGDTLDQILRSSR